MRHQVSKVLPYTPQQLFQLVGDVAKYPDFVPWITSMRTWNERTLSVGVEAAFEVIDAKPDVFNHNLETVPRLYLSIRPGARYYHSLRLLERVKERDPAQFTKSGVMVGLGETKEEVMQVMDDMRSAGIDFITIGQYLQPTRKHAAIDRFVHPDEFRALEEIAKAKGFLMVASSPLTRSSYHAGEDFEIMRNAREAQLAAKT